MSEAIDGAGCPVRETDDEGRSLRKVVRARTIAADLEWLKGVLIWAVRERDAQGRYLLRENPVRDAPSS